MMTLWLPGRPHPCGHSHKTAAEEAASSSSAEVEPSMIPAYASHSLGIGCIVLNSRGELLVIQEKFAHPMLPDFWKLVRAQAHVALSGDKGRSAVQASQCCRILCSGASAHSFTSCLVYPCFSLFHSPAALLTAARS